MSETEDPAIEEGAAPALRGFQKRFLRQQAHARKAVVQVGEGGVSAAVIAALRQALRDHELVKVRLRSPDDKKATAALLAERSGAALCGIVGHTVILYAPHPEKPRLVLPTRAPGNA